jgi:hypothetical protein
LDGNGNLPFAVDFRSLYATAIEKWGDAVKFRARRKICYAGFAQDMRGVLLSGNWFRMVATEGERT